MPQKRIPAVGESLPVRATKTRYSLAKSDIAINCATDGGKGNLKQLQILLSDRFLIAINATLEVTEIVYHQQGWHAIPPFAGEDNPVITAVWQGPAHGLCVFQR